MKRAAIFDMDGLLFDTERIYQEGWVVTARQFGYIPDPDFTSAICGTSGQTAYGVINKYYPGSDAPLFWDFCVKWVFGELEKSVPVMPGAEEILAFFQEKGVKVGVASSSERKMIEGNLSRTGLTKYIDVIVSGYEVEHGKPEPDIFIKAAGLLGYAPEECYVFEDGVNGARAGIAAGCATVMVPDLVPPTDDVIRGCAAICANLNEARGLIESGRI